MTVIEIVEHYLKVNGYDGLYCPGECACLIGELVPCETDMSQCEPRVRVERDGQGETMSRTGNPE